MSCLMKKGKMLNDTAALVCSGNILLLELFSGVTYFVLDGEVIERSEGRRNYDLSFFLHYEMNIRFEMEIMEH